MEIYKSKSSLFIINSSKKLPTVLSNYLIHMLLLVTRPLPRDGGMAEDHEAPEAGQLPRVWTRGRRETETPKSERHKVRSWTAQNEMRGVLRRVSTGAAGRILDSANPKEVRA